MKSDYPSDAIVPFDLDEDSVIDAVAVDDDGDGAADVVAFDLDEDAVYDSVVVDTDGDAAPDLAAFDLDEDAVMDTTFVEGSPISIPAMGDPFDLTEDPPGADVTGYVTGALPEDDSELEDDSFTPPEEITNEDVDQAMQDVQHSQAMNQYMTDLGVIDYDV